MVSAMDQRKCWLMLLLFVYQVCSPDSIQAVATNGPGSGIVERVSRRQNNDVYFFMNDSNIRCDNRSLYMVSECQCVKDQELFKRCSEAIVPISSLHLTTIADINPDSSSVITYLLTAAGNGDTYETFKINETDQLVNSSHCHISSLEVYRGRQQAIEISHQGFSLSKNGSIKITTGELGYDLEDYIGELYRMDLSCSGGLPESGCLFFKATGVTNVTRTKFNNSVSGTIREADTTTTLSNSPSSAGTRHTSPSTTGTSNMMLNPSDQASEPDLFIYIIVAATGIVALLFVVVLLCMVLVYCCSVDKKRNHGQGSGVTVATNLWFEQRDLLVLNNPPGPPYDANTLETVQ